ncbi:MAG: hypothetical protein K8S14_05055 [Actinomycetia bacterium]|nr:hypothetical protein [Actinomycetes bacterium]
MSLFKRKKIMSPKNPLGMALFQYDNIIKKELGGLLRTLSLGKSINPSRGEAILDKSMYKFDYILEDLSKDNLKIDYRSDKIRYGIINMIEDLKNYFERVRQYNFDGGRLSGDRNLKGPEKINEDREDLKKKMKDIESDYL